MHLSPFLRDAPRIALLLAIGLAGALLAHPLGLPMPFLTGALLAVGAHAIWRTARGLPDAVFPKRPRQIFVALIGVMIGASFSLDLMGSLPGIWPSLLVMVLYVAVAMAAGYALFRVAGGYDPLTAIYAAMPGGLIEAVALGEEAGADVKTLALHHFARVVLVVVAVPFLYLLWSGDTVGSAGGQGFQAGPSSLLDVAEIVGLGLFGLWLGPRLRLPASHLVGPLLLSAVLHGTGLLHLVSPDWLLALSQLVVGVALGGTFGGTGARDLVRTFALGLVYVAAVLGMGYGVAISLPAIVPFDFDTLFVSFAPGGVTEMGLVALSLGISPVIVTAHHVFRIGLTVMIAGLVAKRFARRAPR